MAFKNEYVPAGDVKKFGLEDINRKHRKVDVDGHYSWTVDRERDIYLRWMSTDKETAALEQEFVFYWKGTLLVVRLSHRRGAEKGGKITTIWTLHSLSLPASLQADKQTVIEDLKAALREYKTGGVYSKIAYHQAEFEF